MTTTCDILITGGRLIDPQHSTDEITTIAISQGRIASLGEQSLEADRVIDASGKIIAPGFIDVHSHAQNIPGHRLQAFDGVTTTFEMEAGASPVASALEWAASEGRPLNYGFSAGWLHTRARVLENYDDDALAALPDLPLDSMGVISAQGSLWNAPATAEQREEIIRLLEEQLDAGAIGIGVLLGYAAEAEPAELMAVAELGARRNMPLFVHTRIGPMLPGKTPLEGIEELLEASLATGAHIHMCHFNSSASSHPREAREKILAAQAEGVRFTTELYPYGFSSTVIGAGFLDPEILEAAGRPPGIITPVATGQPAESYAEIARLRQEDPSQLCLIRYYQDPWDGADLAEVMSLPGALFASDAMPLKPLQGQGEVDIMQWPLPEGVSAHPRSTACFTRALAWLHRDRGLLELSDVIARSTVMPAQLLRGAIPAMERKGHLGLGADADLVIFDLEALQPNTSISPVEASRGVEHLLVGGTPVISDGELLTGALPGGAVLPSNP
ncbi:amidohydrolase family protein [Nesterenkonia sp. MY13]|uniref:Amidohydrolase family protein n=1 Tax=Nesterenkonia sedimenti TaxID=1463632 RepID=A0A7X8TKA8_9MICC|nr:amidohydrolase family protein [Nesterenkonia sedimenti]NLS10370.1 amidohydrolase family protein [Nesterenkonia sedimenti]